MHFDHDFGIISSLVKIDTTVQPQQGGSINVLDIIGTGGVSLPAGDNTTRVGSAGVIRFNNATMCVEYYNGTRWSTVNSNESVTATITQSGHGLMPLQLVAYNQSINVFELATDTFSIAGVVSSVIDADTFVLTFYGVIPGWSGGYTTTPFVWYRHPTTGVISLGNPSASPVVAILASIQPASPILIPAFQSDSVNYGCFIPGSAMFARSYVGVTTTDSDATSPIKLMSVSDVASPTSVTTLARHAPVFSVPTYEMPSVYLTILVDMLAINYMSSNNDIVMFAIIQSLYQPVDISAQPEGAPAYLGANGAVTWDPPLAGIKQVVGYKSSGYLSYIAPYVEQAVSGSVYVSNSAPSVTPGIPYMWVQTGLNTDGKGMTFWIEDGVI